MRKALTARLPSVIWFTGLSGAGKSTIASALRDRLASVIPIELLDGDVVRHFSPSGFSQAERNAHVRRVGYLASRLEHHGISSVCALISPYEESRRWVSGICRNYIEVHVSTPLAECEKRDVKGLYALARQGKIAHFTGVDDPYEEPIHPDLSIDTSRCTLAKAVDAVLALWERRTSSSFHPSGLLPEDRETILLIEPSAGA